MELYEVAWTDRQRDEGRETMTTQQRVQAERAYARASAQGVHIIGQGHRKVDGRRVFAVSSATDSQRAYLVTVLDDQLACDCQAGHGGCYCKHRSVVSRRLYEEVRNRPITIWK
jgi:hypothetical protein